MTNVEALKSLYVQLGGSAADVANASTSVEVLNAIAAKYEGDDDAILNPDAIANIAAVADSIGGGGSGGDSDYNTATVSVTGSDGAFYVYCNHDADSAEYMNIFALEDGNFNTYLYAPDVDQTVTGTLLYKGDSYTLSPYNVVVSVTGDAEYDEENFVIVGTGDFTVAGYMDD